LEYLTTFYVTGYVITYMRRNSCLLTNLLKYLITNSWLLEFVFESTISYQREFRRLKYI